MEYIPYNRQDYHKNLDALGEWLNPYDWQWFITLTFHKIVSLRLAGNLFDRFIHELRNDPIFFRVSERNQSDHRTHIHLLLGKVQQQLQWKHGIVDARPYDRNQGARFYIGKYIMRDNVDWDARLAPDQPLVGAG